MYDNLIADMNTRMKPVMDLIETNKKVLEKGKVAKMKFSLTIQVLSKWSEIKS
jgi:hypothetical protein